MAGIMTEEEIIRRILEHLKAMKMRNGSLTKKDLYWCIYYVEDFLMVGRSAAIQFLEKNVWQCSYAECKKKWVGSQAIEYQKRMVGISEGKTS